MTVSAACGPVQTDWREIFAALLPEQRETVSQRHPAHCFSAVLRPFCAVFPPFFCAVWLPGAETERTGEKWRKMGEIWGRNGRETAVAEWRWGQPLGVSETAIHAERPQEVIRLIAAEGLNRRGPAGACRLFLGPGFRLGARWNRLVETVKTRKKREKTGKKWARYSLRSAKDGS